MRHDLPVCEPTKTPQIVGDLEQIKSRLRMIEDAKESIRIRIGYLDGNLPPAFPADPQIECKCLNDELSLIIKRLDYIYDDVSNINERLKYQLG